MNQDHTTDTPAGNETPEADRGSFLRQDDGSVFKLDVSRSASSSLRDIHGVESDLSLTGGESGSPGKDILRDTLSRFSGREEKYVLVREIGRGGMGFVVGTLDTDIRREVAMKLLHGGKDASRESILRFLEEAQIQGQLEHPSICPVHELGLDGTGRVYFTMKLIKGKSLGNMIRKAKTDGEFHREHLSTTRALNLFLKICDGLAFAHSRGVLHRDMKPDNIMVGDFGEVYIMDWGLARITDRSDDRQAGVTIRDADDNHESLNTLDGSILGTPAYMPPEQARGQVDELDERSDIYSLGALLYELLTLECPFFGKTATDILRYVITKDPWYPSRRAVRHNISPELDVIVMKCLEKDKEKRYQSIADLKADIEDYLAGKPISTMEYSLPEVFRKWVARNPVRSSLILALIVVFLVSFLSIVKLWRDAASAEQRAVVSMKDTQKHLVRSLIGQARFHEEKKEFNIAVSLYEEVRDKVMDGRLDVEPFIDLRIWKARRNSYPIKNLIPCTGGRVPAVAVSPDGRLLAAGDKEGSVRLYDLAAGEELKVLTGHLDEVTDVAFNPSGNLLASSSLDGSIRLREAETGDEITVLTSHTGIIKCLDFSPDGRFLASGGFDGTIRLWKSADWTQQTVLKAELQQSEGIVWDLDFSPDGRWLAAGYGDYQARLWDMEKHQVIDQVHSDSSPVNALAFNWCGDTMAVGYIHGLILQWDATIREGDRFKVLRGHNEGVHDLKYLDGENHLASASSDHTIRIWEGDSVISSLTGHRGPVLSLAVSPDESTLVSGCRAGMIMTWDLTRKRTIHNLWQGDETVILTMACSSDGRLIAVGGDDKSIRIIEKDTGSETVFQSGHDDEITSLAFHPDSGMIASAGLDKQVKLWDVKEGQEVAALTVPGYFVHALTFNLNGRLLAAAGDAGITIWDTVSKQQITVITDHECPVGALAFSPDGKFLASGDFGMKTLVWDTITWKMSAGFGAPGHECTSLAFSPDGKVLASAGNNGQILLYDPRTRNFIGELDGHRGRVTTMAFGSDPRLIASGSYDQTVRFWDTGSCEEITALGFRDMLVEVHFTPDAQTLIAGTGTEISLVDLGVAAAPLDPGGTAGSLHHREVSP